MARKPNTNTRTVQQKADAAEKRKGKKADTVQAPKAAEAVPVRSANDDLDRGMFLDYLGRLAGAEQVLKTAKEAIAVIYKSANQDGFGKKDFEEAKKLQGVEGEKAKKAAIARSLKIARWLGFDLGAQLDMFEEPARVPAVDRAFEEGKTQGLAGITADPSAYSPSTPQFTRYMEGWHAGQAVRANGFKKLKPAVAEDVAKQAAKDAQVAAQKEQDAQTFDAPASGVAMTRSEFKKQQEQQVEAKPN